MGRFWGEGWVVDGYGCEGDGGAGGGEKTQWGEGGSVLVDEGEKVVEDIVGGSR